MVVVRRRRRPEPGARGDAPGGAARSDRASAPAPGTDAAADDLARCFRDREAGAVRRVHDRYGRAMYAVAVSMLGDRTLAAECVQEAFVKAWRAADRVDPARDLGPWLATITRRTAIDVHRRERRHQHRDEPADHDVVTPPPSFVRAWEVFEVRRALDALPAEEQAVIRLTYVDGLTHREAAGRLGVPLGTVKSRSHRAQRRLAGLLAHVGEVGP